MKYLSVNMVLAAFTFLETLLRRIMTARDAEAAALNDQINSLRVRQAEATNEAVRAQRVAGKIKELTS